MATRSCDDYFEAGLDLLSEGGARAVTIANLCQRLGVTKGSFYHHFASGPDFLRQLLHHWEVEYGLQRLEATVAVTNPGERMELAKRLAVDFLHEAETAIRALARTDPLAAEVQGRVDRGREAALVETYVEAGMPEETARTLARVGMTILVGTQQMERPVDRPRLFALFDEYQRWLETTIAASRTARRRRTAS
jgi:AcrR family transcriptional regulator